MSRNGKNIIIIGAAGRDFHNFNSCYKDKDEYNVVAFTAAQFFASYISAGHQLYFSIEKYTSHQTEYQHYKNYIESNSGYAKTGNPFLNQVPE